MHLTSQDTLLFSVLQFHLIPFSKSIERCVPQRICYQTAFLSLADICLKHYFPKPSAYYLCFSEMCSIIIWICFQAQGHAQVFLICKKSLKHLLGEEKIRDKTMLCSRLPLQVSSDIGNREKCQLYNHPNVTQISCCCAKFSLG